MMRSKLLSLALLLLLAFSLSAGAHPCGEMERTAAKTAPSCHEPAPSPAHGHHGPGTGSSGQEDGSSPASGAPPCPHVCHAVAVASFSPAISALGLVARLQVSEAASPLPPLGQRIDKIPLS